MNLLVVIIIVFLFGLLIGSFLNVCIYRLPRPGMSIVSPPSHCPSCNAPIRWYQNIPVFSYLFLLGRCGKCRAPISLRYPIVELLTGALFAFAAWQHLRDYSAGLHPDFETVVHFMAVVYLIANLIVMTFIDLEFRIIPDEISISGIIIAPIVSALFPFIHQPLPIQMPEFLNGLLGSLAGMIAGGGVVYLVGVIGKIIFKKEAMGFGDVKLMAFLGGFLGWYAIIFAFIVGCIIGALVGIVSYFITKDHYIAFGPYLALGALMMMFFRPAIVHFAFVTYPQFIRNLVLL